MNQKLLGSTITALRKRLGLTQAELASRLNVTDKAVSKWETGLGYPEITILPKLAATLGVTVDYLLSGARTGITVAGNIILDIVKSIDCYPKIGMLSNITAASRAIGGCAPNTAIDLAKIDPSLPVSVIGCVGEDEYGRYAISQLRHRNIDTARIRVTEEAPTSFTDVMSTRMDRTFFHMRGANALFCPEDIEISRLNCRMLHIGYILLLDSFDADDPEYGTVMARFLHDVQEAGIKTSIDVVSDSTADYPGRIIPALRWCNYVIINEIECCSIWGLNPRNADGSLNVQTIRDAMARTMACGVAEKVIVHSKEAGFCLSSSGEFTAVPSLQIPPEEISGSVGAGDAFCAGCLYSIYQNESDSAILEFASAAAACSLFAANATDGMLPRQELLQRMRHYPRRERIGCL